MPKQTTRYIIFTTLIFIASVLSLTMLLINIQMVFKNYQEPTQFVVVTTNYGRVLGQKQWTLYKAKSYYWFKGIPYAKPPLGTLRFKPPQRPYNWSHIYDATGNGRPSVMCVQRFFLGVEDCLYINIYTPNLEGNALLPVVIAIHEGTFQTGSSNNYAPDFLLNEAEVVVVTFNYRIGALGFMSLNTSEYSGNMGLKDQLMAIKWTHENIYSFGGNKNKITLHGMSAGSVSAHMHMLSPASKGLFQRAILVSGTANLPWAIQQKSQVPRLQEFAVEMGRPHLNAIEMISFLQEVDPYELTARTNGWFYVPGKGRIENSMLYGPVVEHPDAEEPFMLESPMKMIENPDFINDIDVMFGVAYRESYYYIHEELYVPQMMQPINQSKEVQMPLYEMNANLNYSSKEYKIISEEIIKHYFGPSKNIDIHTSYSYNAMWSDIMFGYGIDRSVRIYANSSTANVFYYRLMADTNLNMFKNDVHLSTHGTTIQDELLYTFGSNDYLYGLYTGQEIGAMERKMITTMSSIYTSFIKNGHPVLPTYPYIIDPVKKDKIFAMDISNDIASVTRRPLANNLFWDHIIGLFNSW